MVEWKCLRREIKGLEVWKMQKVPQLFWLQLVSVVCSLTCCSHSSGGVGSIFCIKGKLCCGLKGPSRPSKWRIYILNFLLLLALKLHVVFIFNLRDAPTNLGS